MPSKKSYKKLKRVGKIAAITAGTLAAAAVAGHVAHKHMGGHGERRLTAQEKTALTQQRLIREHNKKFQPMDRAAILEKKKNRVRITPKSS